MNMHKTPASPRTTAKPLAGLHAGEGKRHLPGTPLPSQPRHHYRALKAARGRLLKPQTSTNNRFKQAKYGMKRLAKVERGIQENSKGRPSAIINPTPESWYISIPNGCRCSKGRKPPISGITCLSPSTIS